MIQETPRERGIRCAVGERGSARRLLTAVRRMTLILRASPSLMKLSGLLFHLISYAMLRS